MQGHAVAHTDQKLSTLAKPEKCQGADFGPLQHCSMGSKRQSLRAQLRAISCTGLCKVCFCRAHMLNFVRTGITDLSAGTAKFNSRKQAFEATGAFTFGSRCLKMNHVIKSAASAASPMTKMQGSPRTTARHMGDGGQGLPCISAIGEAALAVDLITQLIFKHLEQNLAVPGL